MTRLRQMPAALVILLVATAVGCRPSQPFYLFDDGDMSHYRDVATQIEYPDVTPPSLAEVDGAEAPFTVKNAEIREYWDLTLEQAIQYCLANSKVMRTSGGRVLGPPGQLLAGPDQARTVYDPAIQESNPRTGVEGALSQFDAQLSSNIFWQKNDRPINVGGFGNLIFAPVFEQDLANSTTELRKTTATGSTFFFRNNTAYDWNNNPTRRFPSDWNTNFEAEFRQPLLQGAGVQFNRIAGPNAVPGFFFSNGVILARINNDIVIADFEYAVRNLVMEVETAYWELHFQYRNLDALLAGRDSALVTYQRVHALWVTGSVGGEAEKEAQAREQYFLFRGQVENALSTLFATESRLRYLMGLAATDGRLIRPMDEPTTARVHFDWHEVQLEAMARAVELRRQKWRIKQREMELIASRNFLLPRLDASGIYRWRGFGNDLIGYGDNPPGSFQNAYQTLFEGNYQEWQLGLQLTVPIGFRQAMAAVRNAQLTLARDRAILQEMELELSHTLSEALREVDQYYVLSETGFNRRVAAATNVTAVQAVYETGSATLDLLLDAQRRLADAESSYYRNLVNYNLSIRDVHLRKGSLLEYNNVYLAEGPWPGKAYFDARKRARERDAGLYINYGYTNPRVMSRGKFQQFIHDNFMQPGIDGTPAQGTPTEAPPEEVQPGQKMPPVNLDPPPLQTTPVPMTSNNRSSQPVASIGNGMPSTVGRARQSAAPVQQTVARSPLSGGYSGQVQQPSRQAAAR
ncbi:MAG: TolC family protein [Planctomycetaceae bacterium]|nr:TolC family protein [Planctomycetaceae bacterium]